MVSSILNKISPVVVKEIEEILATYPQSPYQEVFKYPHYKQILVAYVLSRISHQFITTDEIDQHNNLYETDHLHLTMPQLLHIESLIHQGIEQILSEQAEDLHQYVLGGVVDPACLRSNWLG